jgi:hypothetical protein
VHIVKYIGYIQRPAYYVAITVAFISLQPGATMPPLRIVDGAFEDMEILRRRNQQLQHAIIISIESAGISG